MAIASGTMAFGKLLLGYLFDKIRIRMATITSTLAAAIGLISLYLVKKGNVFFLLIVLGVGFGSAFFTVSTQSICKKLYGNKDYGNFLQSYK